MQSLKIELHKRCIEVLEEKISRLQQAIQDAQQAASEDTKSSAGDKFETSREMMKLEIDKNNLQLSKNTQMLTLLNKIKPEQRKEHIGFGSLVTCNEGIYYFSVGLGKVEREGTKYFALSMASPIGKALQDKKAGDKIEFMNRQIHILEIS